MSAPRLSIEALHERTHLSPRQIARLYGHGKDFWIGLFEEKLVPGYVLRGRRYLDKGACRAFLDSLQQSEPAVLPFSKGAEAIDHKTHLRLQRMRRKYAGIQLSLPIQSDDSADGPIEQGLNECTGGRRKAS